MLYNTQIETEELVEVKEKILPSHKLIVYNDEVNTFEHVIEALIEVCGLEAMQAEQCTMLIHFKGKCRVKSGSFDDLLPMRQGICDRGISAEIEE
ncbi:MAG: ATP-dependent Clp protease adaptor ClpS [Cytophagales bacterium]|nr:ATP-dependent Clp protease adaptor ClpS [Cytophagales bacterium]